MVETLRKKIAAIMTMEKSQPILSLASVLWGLSRAYGAAMGLRRRLYNRGLAPSHRLPCYVISVGNLCMGGTGKTPMAVYLCRLIRDMGLKAAVVSRGYKGQGESAGAVVSDGNNVLCDVHCSGDEPFLMAHLLQNVPVLIGKNRVAAGQTALEQFQTDVLVLDDGFQHQRLQRDLNLLLLDANKPFGNSHVMPRGPLREPLAAMADADAVIVTRSSKKDRVMRDRIPIHSQCPVFYTRHKPVIRGILPAGQAPSVTMFSQSDSMDLEYLAGRRVFAFSGLAHNDAFWETLEQCGAQIDGTLSFDDHHPYHEKDTEAIAVAARDAGTPWLVTTDKDFVRLPPTSRFACDLIVMGITIDFGNDSDRWLRFISQRTGVRFEP